MKKNLLTFFLMASLNIFAQFEEDIPKIKLYDMAADMNVYGYTLVKDKLFLINNIMKDDAAQEFDFAMAKIEEYLATIDMAEENPKVKEHLKAIKAFWYKFNQKVTQNMNNEDFKAISYDINNWDRLTSDLMESMKTVYDLPLNKLNLYNDVQYFRKLIQKISMSYLANFKHLSKSLMHEYKKNIEQAEKFIRNNSDKILNDTVAGSYILEVIVDWNFLKSNLQHPTQKNPQTIFMLSVSIDYHLRQIKNRFVQKMLDTF